MPWFDCPKCHHLTIEARLTAEPEPTTGCGPEAEVTRQTCDCTLTPEEHDILIDHLLTTTDLNDWHPDRETT